jgi:hypothetical protein
MRKPIILSLVFITLLTSLKAQQTNASIKLDFFKSIPKVIDGCSGIYTYDTTRLKKERYIFISNVQDLGLIKVNGKTISLKMVSNKQLSKVSWKYVFKGSGYIITLTTQQVKQTGEEVSLESGTLEVINGANKLTTKIHGESGC